MPFHVCYYHVVWAVKNREPLIIPEFEPVIIGAVTHKSTELNCPVVAINCVSDHVHVAVSIIPSVAIATWVGNVKGFSTHEIKALDHELSPAFRWQKGYGVLTFGKKNLAFVVDYIARQKEHHQQGTAEPYLERID